MLSHSFASMDTPGALELFYRKVLVTERSEVLRAGDFVLRTTSVSPLDRARANGP